MLADVSIYTGYLTIGLMLGGRFVFRYLGWKVAALATPAIMFLTGGAFFGLSLAASMGANGVIFGGLNLATGGALAGAVTQVIPLIFLFFSEISEALNTVMANPCDICQAQTYKSLKLQLEAHYAICKNDSCLCQSQNYFLGLKADSIF